MEDLTNQELHRALRNRIRGELLPLLAAQYNPRVVHAIVRLAEQGRESADALRQIAEQALHAAILRESADEIALRVGDVQLPQALQSEIVPLIIPRLGCAW